MHLVLLPGLDGTGILFRPFIESLPADIQPVVIPFPGTEALDYPGLVRFVAPRLPRSAPFVLLGESFSGPIALQLAAEPVPGIVGVILCASFVSNPTVIPSFFRHLAGPWLFRFTPAFVQAKALLGGYFSPDLRDLLASAHGIVSAPVMTQRIRSILSVDATPALRATRQPLCYLRGLGDHVVPARNLRRIQAVRPDVQVHLIPAPHLVLQLQPKAAAQAVSSFIASLEVG
jgi:pimeloyl-ACP methyl ester carboxylesterase